MPYARVTASVYTIGEAAFNRGPQVPPTTVRHDRKQKGRLLLQRKHSVLSCYQNSARRLVQGADIKMVNSIMSADTRLVTYGTLAPGRPNNHQLADLKGSWRLGTVRGRLVEAGWGAELGFPGLILDPSGHSVEVHLFESADLPNHWLRLDAFEGAGYRRVITQVSTADGDLDASIYVIEA